MHVHVHESKTVHGNDRRARLRPVFRNQEEHHRKRTFQEEFLRYLSLNQIEYDETLCLEVKFARTAPRHKNSFNVTPGCARKLADPGLRSVPPPGAVFGQLQRLAKYPQNVQSPELLMEHSAGCNSNIPPVTYKIRK